MWLIMTPILHFLHFLGHFLFQYVSSDWLFFSDHLSTLTCLYVTVIIKSLFGEERCNTDWKKPRVYQRKYEKPKRTDRWRDGQNDRWAEIQTDSQTNRPNDRKKDWHMRSNIDTKTERQWDRWNVRTDIKALRKKPHQPENISKM